MNSLRADSALTDDDLFVALGIEEADELVRRIKRAGPMLPTGFAPTPGILTWLRNAPVHLDAEQAAALASRAVCFIRVAHAGDWRTVARARVVTRSGHLPPRDERARTA